MNPINRSANFKLPKKRYHHPQLGAATRCKRATRGSNGDARPAIDSIMWHMTRIMKEEGLIYSPAGPEAIDAVKTMPWRTGSFIFFRVLTATVVPRFPSLPIEVTLPYDPRTDALITPKVIEFTEGLFSRSLQSLPSEGLTGPIAELNLKTNIIVSPEENVINRTKGTINCVTIGAYIGEKQLTDADQENFSRELILFSKSLIPNFVLQTILEDFRQSVTRIVGKPIKFRADTHRPFHHLLFIERDSLERFATDSPNLLMDLAGRLREEYRAIIERHREHWRALGIPPILPYPHLEIHLKERRETGQWQDLLGVSVGTLVTNYDVKPHEVSFLSDLVREFPSA